MGGYILMIEDDERLAAMVSVYLGEADFRVNHHGERGRGLAAFKHVRFDALIPPTEQRWSDCQSLLATCR